jgi:hypothetical protein
MESPLVLALDTDDLEQAAAWSRAAGDAAGMVRSAWSCSRRPGRPRSPPWPATAAG